jgi:hypothetical protein
MVMMMNFSLSQLITAAFISVHGRLHHVDVESVADISETSDTSIFTVEVYKVGEFLARNKMYTYRNCQNHVRNVSIYLE